MVSVAAGRAVRLSPFPGGGNWGAGEHRWQGEGVQAQLCRPAPGRACGSGGHTPYSQRVGSRRRPPLSRDGACRGRGCILEDTASWLTPPARAGLCPRSALVSGVLPSYSCPPTWPQPRGRWSQGHAGLLSDFSDTSEEAETQQQQEEQGTSFPHGLGALGAWGWAVGWRGPRTSLLYGEGLVTCSLALGGRLGEAEVRLPPALCPPPYTAPSVGGVTSPLPGP